MKEVFTWSIILSDNNKPESNTNKRCLCIDGLITSKPLDKIKVKVGSDLSKYELNKKHRVTIEW